MVNCKGEMKFVDKSKTKGLNYKLEMEMYNNDNFW